MSIMFGTRPASPGIPLVRISSRNRATSLNGSHRSSVELSPTRTSQDREPLGTRAASLDLSDRDNVQGSPIRISQDREPLLPLHNTHSSVSNRQRETASSSGLLSLIKTGLDSAWRNKYKLAGGLTGLHTIANGYRTVTCAGSIPKHAVAATLGVSAKEIPVFDSFLPECVITATPSAKNALSIHEWRTTLANPYFPKSVEIGQIHHTGLQGSINIQDPHTGNLLAWTTSSTPNQTLEIYTPGEASEPFVPNGRIVPYKFVEPDGTTGNRFKENCGQVLNLQTSDFKKLADQNGGEVSHRQVKKLMAKQKQLKTAPPLSPLQQSLGYITNGDGRTVS